MSELNNAAKPASAPAPKPLHKNIQVPGNNKQGLKT